MKSSKETRWYDWLIAVPLAAMCWIGILAYVGFIKLLGGNSES